VDVAKQLLSLQASLVSIEKIEKALAETLGALITEEFSISATNRIAPLREEFVPTISRLTNTFIENTSPDTVCDPFSSETLSARLLIVAVASYIYIGSFTAQSRRRTAPPHIFNGLAVSHE